MPKFYVNAYRYDNRKLTVLSEKKYTRKADASREFNKLTDRASKTLSGQNEAKLDVFLMGEDGETLAHSQNGLVLTRH